MEKSDRRKVVPRVCIIVGKTAPGYENAKKISSFVFIPDYNVSVAELVIPGSDISQHISTAGHEASGNGSMKFLMNGCLILVTADGSTVEIIEKLGADDMVNEVPALREKGATGRPPLQFAQVVRFMMQSSQILPPSLIKRHVSSHVSNLMVRDGYFGFKDYFKSLCDTLEDDKDFYLLGSDFASYLEALASFLLFFSSNPHQKHVEAAERFLPWLVTGDFNEVGSQSENYGGLINHARCCKFNSVLNACNLIDLGFEGPGYT
ncbi:hypothetical protein LguiA_014972 [Lonicera macranthoides]